MPFTAALAMKYFFDRFEFTSGGALGSLTLGLLVKELWKRGWPPGLAVDKGHQAAQQVSLPLKTCRALCSPWISLF